MSDADTARVLSKLAAKGVSESCGRCGHRPMAFSQFSFIPVRSEAKDFELMGPASGAVVMACANCGHMDLHSTKVLGL